MSEGTGWFRRAIAVTSDGNSVSTYMRGVVLSQRPFVGMARTPEPTTTMKRTFVTLACVFAASTFSAHAQGTIAFGNRVVGLIDAPMFDFGGARLAGPNAYAQLYVGGHPVGVPVAFRSGAGAGYWPTTTVVVPGVAPGEAAAVQAKWWRDASSYEAATFRCASAIISVVTGGAGSPPSLPAYMVGLTSTTCLPEASTAALGLLAACALVLWRSGQNTTTAQMPLRSGLVLRKVKVVGAHDSPVPSRG